MPQWSRDRSADSGKYPDERRQARCPRADAPLLLRYDHHVVFVDRRPALLRTWHWAEQEREDWPDELPFHVSFTYPRGHPAAPSEVQAVVDRLAFVAADDSERPAGDRR